MVKQGSVILLVLMMLAMLTIFGITVLRSTTFLVDGVFAREQYAKQHYATEALMHYALAIGEQHFNNFEQLQKEAKINVGSWPLVNSPYVGTVIFSPEKHGIKIQALLKKDNHICCAMSSLLVHQGNTSVVENWKIG